MASDFMSKFGIGGQSGNKVRLVADLTSEYAKLNTVLEKTKKLSEDIAKNLRKATGKGGGTGDVMGGMNLPPIGPAANIPMGQGSGDFTSLGFQGKGAGKLEVTTPTGFVSPNRKAEVWDNFKANIGQLGLGLAAGGAQAVDVEGMIMNDVVRRRFGFYSGQPGTQAGSGAMRTLMNRGTFMDPMDAAGAVSAGASMGLMPGMKNYNTVLNSMATVSNLTPGVSGEQAAGAVSGLNQARNVNMLRMIGINVRNEQGLMRGFEDIANDLWSTLTRQKTGAGKITAEDLALSLQPGNSLDMLLNQYFGNDPVLRQSVVAALYQKAGGGSFSKESLQKSGANPEVTQSFGRRKAAEYGAIDTFTDAGTRGVITSNDMLTNVANVFADATGLFKSAVDVFVGFTSGGQNIMGAFGGAPGTILGSVVNFGRNLFSKAAGGEGVGGEGVGGSGVSSPLKGKLSTPTHGEFGNQASFRSRKHRGVDFRANTGDPVFAVKDGTVVKAGDEGDLGNMVRIKHKDGNRTVYAHLSKIAARKDSSVSAGELIGYAGYSGGVNPKGPAGAHLHLGLETSSGKAIDPSAFLSGASPVSSADEGEASDTAETKPKSLWSQTSGSSSLWSDSPTTDAAGGEGVGAIGGSSYVSVGNSGVNYGGVTVNINVPTGTALNEEKLAREIKRVLADEEQLRMAVTR
jgi:murein DD-endopeptidase MepM/ murein hydrolase activator NlpD